MNVMNTFFFLNTLISKTTAGVSYMQRVFSIMVSFVNGNYTKCL